MEPTVTELLIEGLKLMMVGMTIVFGFLLLLVAMLFGMSGLASRLASDQAPADSGQSLPAFGGAGAADLRRVAVIAAAVRQYRYSHRS